MRHRLIAGSALLLTLIAFQCGANRARSGACIDEARINPNAACTMEYDPVCGCDGKTYGNACQAENAGLTRWTAGACPDDGQP